MRVTSDQLRPLFASLETRDSVSDAEKETLLGAVSEVREFSPGSDIVAEGSRPTTSTLVLKGMTARYSTVEDGGRQITALHIAGDFVDLHSFPLKLMDHAVTAVDRCVVALFPHAGLERITESQPHLTRILWMLTLIDGSISRQWLVAKGRLTADEQLAHLFCELFVRSEAAGLARGSQFSLPITQEQLSDALGLSIVHTNRTLQRLRRTGALSWQDGRVDVLDWPLLRELGQFDPKFLHLERLHR